MFSSVLLFFEFSAPEIMLIMFVALLLFGGEKLPGLARGLGKGIREFKDASEGVKREITNQIDNFEAKKAEESAAKNPAETSADINETPALEEHADNSVPVAEIHSDAEVAPVKEELNKVAKPARLKKTSAKHALPDERMNVAQEEHKS